MDSPTILAGGLAGYEPDEFVKFDGEDDGEADLEKKEVRVARKFWHLALLLRNESQHLRNESQHQFKARGCVVKSARRGGGGCSDNSLHLSNLGHSLSTKNILKTCSKSAGWRHINCC